MQILSADKLGTSRGLLKVAIRHTIQMTSFLNSVCFQESAVEEKVPVQSRLDRDLESYDLDPSGKGSLIRSGPGRSRGPESFRRAMGSEDGSSSIVSGKVSRKES